LFIQQYIESHVLVSSHSFGALLTKAVCEAARSPVFDMLRKSMMIILPLSWTIDEDASSIRSSILWSRRRLSPSFRNLIDTLALPLDSDSLRRMQGKWKRSRSVLSLRNTRNTSTETPSSSSADQSISHLSSDISLLRVYCPLIWNWR